MSASTITASDISVDILQSYFPNKKIHDASDKSIEEILHMIEVCKELPALLVYIQRNSLTECYFNAIEETTMERFSLLESSFIHNKPTTVVINCDNYIWFDETCPNVIAAINQMINEENECVICKEVEADIQFLKCACTTNLCKMCFDQLSKKICPVCQKPLCK